MQIQLCIAKNTQHHPDITNTLQIYYLQQMKPYKNIRLQINSYHKRNFVSFELTQAMLYVACSK